MKRYFGILMVVTSLFASQTACKKDFLEIVPKGNQVAVTTADYDLLLNSQSHYYYTAAGGLREFVLMGDEVAAEADLFGKNDVYTPRAFQWLGKIYERNDQPLDLANQTGEMYVINKIINEVMSSTDGTDAQKNAIQGEAKARRAFINFLWVNIFGKPYQASSAAIDPAFPLITAANISATKFTRASVQEMYDAIIKDLTDAIAVLPLQSAALTRVSRPAAEALLGKVYLFMG